MPHYQIITLDVWGDLNNGFEINNLFESGFFIKDAPEDAPCSHFVSALKVLGFLKPYLRNSKFCLQDNGDGFELSHSTHGPACYLRELDEETFNQKTSSSWMFDRPLVYVDAKIFNWGKLK